MSRHTSPTQGVLHTRAVLRRIEPAASGIVETYCEGCGRPVRFSARHRANRIIANIYGPNGWERVEHYHQDCYAEAGSPHGEVHP